MLNPQFFDSTTLITLNIHFQMRFRLQIINLKVILILIFSRLLNSETNLAMADDFYFTKSTFFVSIFVGRRELSRADKSLMQFLAISMFDIYELNTKFGLKTIR